MRLVQNKWTNHNFTQSSGTVKRKEARNINHDIQKFPEILQLNFQFNSLNDTILKGENGYLTISFLFIFSSIWEVGRKIKINFLTQKKKKEKQFPMNYISPNYPTPPERSFSRNTSERKKFTRFLIGYFSDI